MTRCSSCCARSSRSTRSRWRTSRNSISGRRSRTTTTSSRSSPTAPAAWANPVTELHRFYAERFLVSVHRDEVPAVAEACHTPGRLHTDRRLVALYRLLDALVDTMFPYLAAMDERI